jgi:hypothetical protein
MPGENANFLEAQAGALLAFPATRLPQPAPCRLIAIALYLLNPVWPGLCAAADLVSHLANKFTHIHYQYCSLRFTHRCENIKSGFGRLAACMGASGRAQHDA